MDNVSLFQNIRQAGVASGEVSPDVRKQFHDQSDAMYHSHGAWILNGSLSQRNHSLSQIVEPVYLQKIRKYCGSDSDEISTEEDTHDGQSQKKQKNNNHQTIVIEKTNIK